MKKKRKPLFWIGILVLGFAACSTPQGVLHTLEQDIKAFPVYEFTAVGEIHFQDPALLPEDMLHRYAVTGQRNREVGVLEGSIHFTDEYGLSLFETHIVQTDRESFANVTSMLQYYTDRMFFHTDLPTVADVFGTDTHLTGGNLLSNHVPLDLLSLVSTLQNQTEVEVEEGTFRFPLKGAPLQREVIQALTAPLSLLDTVSAQTQLVDQSPVSILLEREFEVLYLEMVVIFAQDDAGFTVWLTLEMPGFATITADVIHEVVAEQSVLLPGQTITVEEFAEIYIQYREALDRAIFLIESQIVIIVDLPELRMVNHQLNTDLLTAMEMEIGGEHFYVSVMENASNTQAQLGIYSFSSAMNIFYTALPAYIASETLALFVLDYLDTGDYDADEFFRTEMHINAQDTAAVTALYFYDNLVGPTLHIYVLESIDGTDEALLLRIIVLLDSLTNEAVASLNQLGLHIGFDFQGIMVRAIGELR